MATDSLRDFAFPESRYRYSQEIPIKKWNSGKMWLQVGYVKDHPEHNQVVLFKRYTTKGRETKQDKYYINGQRDWQSIANAVEKLWPEIKTSGVNQNMINEAVKKISQETQLLELLATYPDILSTIPEDIDIHSLPKAQKDAFRQLLAAGGSVAQRVIYKLSQEPVEDLEAFDRILEELRLSTVNSLVNHINSRLAFINAFEIAIQNDATYERQGSNSVHNLLKSNIWILDRNYTILHDDETLKNIIIEQFNRQPDSKKSMAKRPDFLCMASRRIEGEPIEKLVIIEIKRPSVTLTMNHMQQLMGYKTILERQSGNQIKNYQCFLIGRQRDQLLGGNDLSGSGYITKTYTDFIGEARQFYEEYLKIIEQNNLAI